MSGGSGPAAPAALGIDASRYASDKAALEHYLANYAEHFAPLRERAVTLFLTRLASVRFQSAKVR